MSFTLTSTSNTLDIVSLDATYMATSHGVGGLLYMKYTKGNEDGVTVTISYATKGLVLTDFYKHIAVNSSTRIISATSFIFTASGNYRLPITWTTEERVIKFTFAQYGVTTATGTLDIDFREAE